MARTKKKAILKRLRPLIFWSVLDPCGTSGFGLFMLLALVLVRLVILGSLAIGYVSQSGRYIRPLIQFPNILLWAPLREPPLIDFTLLQWISPDCW